MTATTGGSIEREWVQVDSQGILILGFGAWALKEQIPALFTLFIAGLLGKETKILAVSRTQRSREETQDEVRQALARTVFEAKGDAKPYDALADTDRRNVENFLDRFFYYAGSVTDPVAWKNPDDEHDGITPFMLENIVPPSGAITVIYSLSPELGAKTFKAMESSGLIEPPTEDPDNYRPRYLCFLEKPFGTDEPSYCRMMSVVERLFRGDDVREDLGQRREIYLLDHYKARLSSLNRNSLRRDDVTVQAWWSRRFIEYCAFRAYESDSVAGRARTYVDMPMGAFSDMVHTHLWSVALDDMLEHWHHAQDADLSKKAGELVSLVESFKITPIWVGQYGPGQDGSFSFLRHLALDLVAYGWLRLLEELGLSEQQVTSLLPNTPEKFREALLGSANSEESLSERAKQVLPDFVRVARLSEEELCELIDGLERDYRLDRGEELEGMMLSWSRTPTCIALRVDTNRGPLAYVPYYMISGKGFDKKHTEADIRFHPSDVGYLAKRLHFRSIFTERRGGRELRARVVFDHAFREPGLQLSVDRGSLAMDLQEYFGGELHRPCAKHYMNGMGGNFSLAVPLRVPRAIWQVVKPLEDEFHQRAEMEVDQGVRLAKRKFPRIHPRGITVKDLELVITNQVPNSDFPHEHDDGGWEVRPIRPIKAHRDKWLNPEDEDDQEAGAGN